MGISMEDCLRQHVTYLCSECHPRNYLSLDNLQKCIDYISDHFAKAGCNGTQLQTFKAKVNQGPMAEYSNVIARFGPNTKQRIIVGAHYDTCYDTPGADDNASAVAGLIEIAYLLGKNQQKLPYRVDCVAYPLEEPPFFATDKMGSAIHAKSLVDEGIIVKAAIILEMIGYFSDTPGSQDYPIAFMKRIWGNRGDFIAVASTLKNYFLVRKLKKSFQRSKLIKVAQMVAPAFVTGIDFSDHRNYIKHGMPALMVTDTAFYRNKHYHEASDTPDKLDYDKMKSVVQSVYNAILTF